MRHDLVTYVPRENPIKLIDYVSKGKLSANEHANNFPDNLAYFFAVKKIYFPSDMPLYNDLATIIPVAARFYRVIYLDAEIIENPFVII